MARSVELMSRRSSLSLSSSFWRRSLQWIGSVGRRPDHPREIRDRVRSQLTPSLWMYDAQMTTELARVALSQSPGSGTGRIDACLLLASSLCQLYDQDKDIAYVEEAVDLERQALALCNKKHPDHHATCCAHLSRSLDILYERTGDLHFLDEALNLEREELSLRPRGHPLRAACCGNLATSLREHLERSGDDCNLDEIIDLEREAFDLRPKGHPQRAASCAHLAISLKIRHERTGSDHLLVEAIDLEREALDLRPFGHPDHAIHCENLAISLRKCYDSCGNHQLLDEVIDLEREALELRPPGHSHRAGSCGNLAISLRTRFQGSGDASLLEEGIELEREALYLRPEGHPLRFLSCGNLANSLRINYERTGDENFLDEAIALERETLSLQPQGHPSRGLSYGNLAISLMRRYSRNGNILLLKEAIDLERVTLSLHPPGHPLRALSCGNLALSLRFYYEICGNESLIQEVLTLTQEALTIAPIHERWRHLCDLAWVYLQKASSLYDVSKAISHLSQSLEGEHDDALQVVQVHLGHLDTIWGCDAEVKHVKLVVLYQRLIDLLPLLVHPSLGPQPQLQALKSSTRLGSDAFVNGVLVGKSTLGLENLEMAQGVVWSQSLHRRDPQLAQIPKLLANKLQPLLQAIAMGSDTGFHLGVLSARTRNDALHANSSEMYALLREIRAFPGLDRFMRGETFETLHTVASNHPAVVLVGAREHYYALIMAPLIVEPTLLTLYLNDHDIACLSTGKDIFGSKRGGPLDESETLRAMKMITPSQSNPLSQYLNVLWHKVVNPVLKHMDLKRSYGHARPRLHWCPTGMFSALPLHAAGIYEGPKTHRVSCADYVVSSYTPTITALLRVQKSQEPLSRSALSFALVAEKQAQDSTLDIIAGVDKEIEHVAAVTRSSSVKIVHQQTGSTTVSGMADMIQVANVVHLACHGIQDTGNATQSGFCLGDGRLTIAKLMELKLDNAFLAFLSACETAKGDKEQPDQAMHLAAAMLFSGFKSVVATMWAISDIDGPKVAKWFYEELLSKEVVDVSSVAYALDSAVGKLRDSGVSPDRWAPFIHMGA